MRIQLEDGPELDVFGSATYVGIQRFITRPVALASMPKPRLLSDSMVELTASCAAPCALQAF